MAFNEQVREEALRRVAEGGSVAEAAREAGCAPLTVRRWMRAASERFSPPAWITVPL